MTYSIECLFLNYNTNIHQCLYCGTGDKYGGKKAGLLDVLQGPIDEISVTNIFLDP